jgi:hypothetical protein
MDRRPAHPSALALLCLAGLAIGCMPPLGVFKAWTATWTVELSDRTGSVASIRILDAAGPGAPLVSDGVRLRNLDSTTIEVAWLGGSCVDCVHFSFAPARNAAVGLRYALGAPCDRASAAGFALAIGFDREIDARDIAATSDWGP